MSTEREQILQQEIRELRYQLDEANDIIEAIRTGQVDALVLDDGKGHELYTLKTADQSYRFFIEKMTEGALTLNEESLILYANSRFADMIGRPLSGVIGRHFTDFVTEEDKEQFNRILKGSWATDSKGEICLNTRNGKLPVQAALTVLALEDRPTLGMFLTDLSSQKEAQRLLEHNNSQLSELNQALELSNNDLQQFASVASHDLQEPLRKIQIFSKFLKEESDINSAISRGYIDKITDAAGRMRSLITDILSYSRLAAYDSVFEPLDLNEIVRGVLEDFELMVSEKSADVVIGPLPTIEGVKGQVKQVFQNVLSNALKFTRTGIKPVIRVSGQRVEQLSFDSKESKDGPYCLVTIEDNGIGFNEKYHSQVFTLFERLNPKDSFEGTGIGMAITKKIMLKHNGMIQAKSQPGKGAAFMLLFPIEHN